MALIRLKTDCKLALCIHAVSYSVSYSTNTIINAGSKVYCNTLTIHTQKCIQVLKIHDLGQNAITEFTF